MIKALAYFNSPRQPSQPNSVFSPAGFAMDMGGGIDIHLTKNFSIRPVKLDYLPVFVDDFETLGVVFVGRTQQNFRAGAGVVFHF